MEYILIKSKRKTISLSVNDELKAVVRAPYSVSVKEIECFVNSNEKWLERTIEKKEKQLERINLSDEEINDLINKAKAYIPERVEYYSNIMKLKPAGIRITKAKKRFGSCSAKNSLCFSCFLMNYPYEAIDYVIVHELAHIKEHNHSKRFYSVIERYLPDYKEREKLLKK